jgi:6-phosphofructokinase 2
MTPIATLTLNPAIDKNTRVDRVVADEKLRCESPSREPGGGGINVARVIHRLDGDTRALFASGGPTGTMLEGLLDEEGVEQTPVEIENWTRENVIVHETSTDRQFRFGVAAGAAAVMTPGTELCRRDDTESLFEQMTH